MDGINSVPPADLQAFTNVPASKAFDVHSVWRSSPANRTGIATIDDAKCIAVPIHRSAAIVPVVDKIVFCLDSEIASAVFPLAVTPEVIFNALTLC
jgi:hypothetical protein